MGDLLLHCTVAWINPPASLVKSKKEPHLAAFGEDYYGELSAVVELSLEKTPNRDSGVSEMFSY